MNEDRYRLYNHIRAAKEWLERAENSLTEEQDLRGDLNLMLARAELQRAVETKEPKFLAARKIISQIAAVGVAGCLAFVLTGMSNGSAPKEAEVVAESESVLPAPDEVIRIEAKAGSVEPPDFAVATPENVGETSERMIGDVEEMTEPSAEEQSKKEFVAEVIESEKISPPVEEPVKQVAPPSAEMQRLMQSAGKLLREQ